MEYQHQNRTKYLIVYHLIFVVKYRKPLFTTHGQRIKELFSEIARQSDFTIQELEVDCDHIHLLICSPPHLAPAQIVRRLKQESTIRLWHECPELRQDFWRNKTFWSDGYFCTSIGNASIETIRQYIENQG